MSTIINLSIVGALLVFGKEIQIMLHPQFWLIEDTVRIKKEKVLPLEVLVEQLNKKITAKIIFIETPEEKGLPGK